MNWFDKYFGNDCSTEDKSIMLREYVKRGMVEQHTDENGEFVFTLTELGERILNDLTAGDKDE